MFKLKKIGLSVIALVALTGCTLTFGSGSSDEASSILLPPAESKEAYALKTASALSLLADFNSPVTTPMIANRAAALAYRDGNHEDDNEDDRDDNREDHARPTDEEIIIDVEKYLGIMQQLLDDQPITVVEETPDLEGYDYKLVVTSTDLTGATSVFVMYYNEVGETETPSEPVTSEEPIESEIIETSEEPSISEAEPISEEEIVSSEETGSEYTSGLMASPTRKYHGQDEHHGGENHHEDDDDDIGEVELVGIVVVNEVVYNLVGEKDDDEISFFIDLDDRNYIKVSQEIDDDETTLKYTIVQDGVKTKIRFNTEIEDGEMAIKLNQAIDGVETRYTFIKRTVEDKEVIFVKILDEALELDVRLFVTPVFDEETGVTTYTYEIVGGNGRYTNNHDHGYHGHGQGGHR